MHWLDRIVDEKVTEARARGLLDNLALKGKPIPDIDQRRKDGWWADSFVKRERQRLAEEADGEDELTRGLRERRIALARRR